MLVMLLMRVEQRLLSKLSIAPGLMKMTFVRITTSIPESIAKKIDRERGDIPRSKYIARILERALGGS
jgi:hypothetical protein